MVGHTIQPQCFPEISNSWVLTDMCFSRTKISFGLS